MVIVWHVPPRGEKPVVLYFPQQWRRIAQSRCSLSCAHCRWVRTRRLSYRGYGGSTGSPTEAGLIADAEAAYAFAAARYPAERIVLWGESLGSASRRTFCSR
jgi:fermentation-respiration switch protein FrsA (DUF1100 family)